MIKLLKKGLVAAGVLALSLTASLAAGPYAVSYTHLTLPTTPYV